MKNILQGRKRTITNNTIPIISVIKPGFMRHKPETKRTHLDIISKFPTRIKKPSNADPKNTTPKVAVKIAWTISKRGA
jgi:hypothetical protein